MVNKGAGNFLSDDFTLAEVNQQPDQLTFKRSNIKILLRTLKSNKLALVCAAMLAILVAASLLAPLSPYDPDKTSIAEKIAMPSVKHLFGTDELGRDYFTRSLYGGRVSLAIGFSSMIFAVLVGTIYGAVSGYVGGWLDVVLMRFIDIFSSIPTLLLIIVINTLVKPSMTTLVIMIGLSAWPGVARIVRADTLTVKKREFVLAAKGLGVSHPMIIIKHIIPNLISQIIIAATVTIARSIIMESTLSFLGYGIQLPKASWGSMLQSAQQYILTTPLLAIIPGLLILITVLCFNVLGDVLQKALDPKLAD